jgi:hypothetical protein
MKLLYDLLIACSSKEASGPMLEILLHGTLYCGISMAS